MSLEFCNIVKPGLRIPVAFATVALALGSQYAAAGDDVLEYAEERIDVTDYFLSHDFHADTGGEDAILDFSGAGDNGRMRYLHKIYSDTLHERYAAHEVEWLIHADDTLLQKGFFSRQRGVGFKKGLVLERPSISQSDTLCYTDTMTIVDACGATSRYVISAAYRSAAGGTVILAPGDTIINTRCIVAEFSFDGTLSSGNERNVGRWRCMRWVTPCRSSALVEHTCSHDWNGDRVTVTICRGSAPADSRLSKGALRRSEWPDELRYIVITDLGGKTLRRFRPEETGRISNCGLTPGWYIVTECYPGKNISSKQYIGKQP